MIRGNIAALLATSLAGAAPALAQDHSMHGMQMPGMAMPAAKQAAKKTAANKKGAANKRTMRTPAQTPRTASLPKVKPAANAKPAMDHGGMDHGGTDHGAMRSGTMDHGAMGHEAMDHGAMARPVQPAADADPMPGETMGADHAKHAPEAGMAMPGMAAVGTALPAGEAAAPAVPMDHYADRFFPAAAMAQARHAMMREQGGQRFTQVMFNLAEVQIRDGRDGYRWDGQIWFGGDIDRLVVKTEGSGGFREGIDNAEVQALFSRAIGPYFNLQAGIRHDFQPSPTRTYATIGIDGLAPYMFDIGAAAFLSDKGELLGRVDGYYDQRITQRLILQPRVEINLSAQNVPETGTGAGLVDVEAGLRLRYEISREFAPYVGGSYEAKTGRSADYARAAGADPTTASVVAGIRFWF